MPGSFRPLFLLCAAALFPVVLPLPAAPSKASRASQAPQPPLPEPDLPLPSKPFELVPRRQVEGERPLEPVPDETAPLPRIVDDGSGETYDPATDPIHDDPVERASDLPNMEQLQIIDAPGQPADGEPMPEIPHVPGLVLPKFRPVAPVPGSTPPARPGEAPLPGDDTSPALLPVPAMELAAKAKWIKSPYQAFKTAREEQKPILIFFGQIINGTGPTVNLNNDLFVPQEFNEFASARLVLTKLQYPSGSAGKNYTEEKLAVLNMVKEKFKIRGFPAIVMLDDKGREIERVVGYSRVTIKEVAYSDAHTILERLKEAEKRFSERKRYRQDRVDRLLAQGYRVWYSTVGTSMLGKMVRADQQQVILMDENSKWRGVRMDQLKLFDAEWARRKQAGLIEDPEPAAETAALDGPPKP